MTLSFLYTSSLRNLVGYEYKKCLPIQCSDTSSILSYLFAIYLPPNLLFTVLWEHFLSTSAMRIMHQLAWLHLAVISSLYLIVQCTPSEGSAVEAPALIDRDDTANYVVYPKDPTNKDQATAISNLLKGLVSDQTTIYVSDTDKVTLFWSAPLTSGNSQTVGSNTNVRFCKHLLSDGSRADELRLVQS